MGLDIGTFLTGKRNPLIACYVDEVPMAAFSAAIDEARLLEVSNQLADLSRH